MKVSNVVFFILLSIYSFGQKNTGSFYSNIYTINGSNQLIPKYPSDNSNKPQRSRNLGKVSQDSIDYDFKKCINEFRYNYSLPALKYDDELSKIAFLQLWYISRSDNIGHYNPDYGATPMDRAKYLNYNNFYWIGEICLMDQRYMEEYPNYSSVNLEYTRTIFDLYWSSPSHRAILQDTKYTRYGFCNYYNQSTKKFYNVTIFMD
jgi:uncharacterized protein YkwD